MGLWMWKYMESVFLHDIKLRKSWLQNGFLRMGAL